MVNKNNLTQNTYLASEEVSSKIFTIPNVISFIRLCLVPIFFVLLLRGFDYAATFLFALAASTDWVDGQIARHTHTVSKLGQVLDPSVDRILMASGVIGLFVIGRLPLWIIIIVLARDCLLLVGGAYLLRKYHLRIPVIFLGKVATTFLFIGFAGLLLNWPLVPGLAVTNLSWLFGWTSSFVSWGIWFVYAGLALALATTLYYLVTAYKKMKAAQHKQEHKQEQEQEQEQERSHGEQ